jgi:hypothetical protein
MLISATECKAGLQRTDEADNKTDQEGIMSTGGETRLIDVGGKAISQPSADNQSDITKHSLGEQGRGSASPSKDNTGIAGPLSAKFDSFEKSDMNDAPGMRVVSPPGGAGGNADASPMTAKNKVVVSPLGPTNIRTIPDAPK